MEIKGHANSDIKGKDLVCAGVSCISVGLANRLIELGVEKEHIIVKSGYIKIDLTNMEIDLFKRLETHADMKVALTQLETMEEVNKQYMKIEYI
jgi:hypothetical protein